MSHAGAGISPKKHPDNHVVIKPLKFLAVTETRDNTFRDVVHVTRDDTLVSTRSLT